MRIRNIYITIFRLLFCIILVSTSNDLKAQNIIFRSLECLKLHTSVEFLSPKSAFCINQDATGSKLPKTHIVLHRFYSCKRDRILLYKKMCSLSVAENDTVFKTLQQFVSHCKKETVTGVFYMIENENGEFVDLPFFASNICWESEGYIPKQNEKILKECNKKSFYEIQNSGAGFLEYFLPYTDFTFYCQASKLKIRPTDKKIRFHYFFISNDFFKKNGYPDNIHLEGNWIDIPD